MSHDSDSLEGDAQTATRARASLRKLRLPAIIMIGITILGALNIAVRVENKSASGDLSLDPFRAQGLTALVLITIVCFTNGIFLYGAYLMLKGKDHRGATVAMKVACVPFLSPGAILGIPVAIWALVILYQPDVKAEFESGESEEDSAPKVFGEHWELSKIEKRIQLLSRVVESEGTDASSFELLDSIDSTVPEYLEKTRALLDRYVKFSEPEAALLAEPLLVTLHGIETFLLENPNLREN